MSAALLLSWTLVSAQVVAGEHRPRVLIVPAATVAPAQVEALYGGFSALGLDAVDREDRDGIDLDGELPAKAARAVTAKDGLVAARAAFSGFDVDTARARLDDAEQSLLQVSAPETQIDLFGDVLLLRAELALAAGEREAAQRDLRRVARLSPERTELHPGLYAPALVEAYAQARVDNEGAPTSSLVLWPRVAEGAEVTVLVDLETAPSVRTRALPAGPHLLTVRAPGTMTRSMWVELDPAAPVVWEPLLTPEGVAAERRASAEQLLSAAGQEAAARALLRSTGAAWVVVADTTLSVFTEESGLIRVGDRTGDALTQATAVQAAVREARRARQAAVEVPRSPTTGAPGVSPEPESDLTVPLLSVAGGAAGLAVLVAVAGGAAATGYVLWTQRPLDPPEPPPTPIGFSCCND